MPTIPKAQQLKATVNSADILNAIRNSAPQSYQDAVPIADINDLNTLNRIGAALYSYQPHMNYFVSALWNRLAVMYGKSKIYTNKLRLFKIGLLEFGETIGEYFVDTTKAHNYDMATAEKEYMKIEAADVKTAYHQMNFQKFYKTTITRENIKMAFLSWQGVDNLVDMMVQALYTTAEWHEYLIMKHMIGQAALNGGMAVIKTPALSWTTAKEVTAAIRSASNSMEYLSRSRNIARVNNFTDKSRQVLIINVDAEAMIDVEVLAAAYNLPYAEFLSGHRIAINAWSMEEEAELAQLMTDDAYNPNFTSFTEAQIAQLNGVPAFLVSRDWFIIADELFEMHQSEYNSDGLYYNDSLHKWSTFSVSPFEEAILFTPGTPTVTAVTVNPTSLTLPPGSKTWLTATVTTTNFAPQGVNWSVAGENGNVTILYDGTLTVGLQATGSYTITATSKFDPTKTATCALTVRQNGTDPVDPVDPT